MTYIKYRIENKYANTFINVISLFILYLPNKRKPTPRFNYKYKCNAFWG